MFDEINTEAPSEGDVTIEDLPYNPLSGLSKELTGIDFENNPEAVLKAMIKDRREVFGKYELPRPDEYPNRVDYCKELIKITEENGFEHKFVEEQQLERHGFSAGLTKNGKILTPYIDFNDCTPGEAYSWSIKFSHELIHRFQFRDNPEMSIERQEYEAYVATYLPVVFHAQKKEYPEKGYLQNYFIVSSLLDYVKGSSLGYYGRKQVPAEEIPWMNKAE